MGICGSFSYSLLNDDSTPYDSNVFYLDTSTAIITVNTNNDNKNKTYNMVLSGKLGTWKSASISLSI